MHRQCTARKSATGERCKAWAIRGGNVCVTHGGAAPQVRKKAEERLAEMVEPALIQLRNLIDSADSDAVKLAAVKDALDRAGYKPVDRSRNEHEHRGGVVIHLPERKAVP